MAKKHIAKKAKWSNKQIFLRIILPILIVSLLTSLGFLLLKLLDNHQGYIPPEDTSSIESSSAAEPSSSLDSESSFPNKDGTTVVQIGEPITLSVEDDLATTGLLGNYDAALPWVSGSMRLTVNKAELYPSISDAGISSEECAYTRDDNLPFILLDITLENIDAETTGDMTFFIGDLISAEAYESQNVQSDRFLTMSPIYYSDHRAVSDETRDYFHGELPPGTSKAFQLGFFADDTPKDVILKLGTNGCVQKYGVDLNMNLSKGALKAELHQAFHNRFFYISFFLMLAFSVFGVFFMELPRESGFDLWREYRFDENGTPLTTLFLPATGLYCKWLGGDAGQFTTAAFYFLVFLVCTVPFSWSLVSEKQSGYESHMVLSAGKPAYYISKYFASFLSGAYAVPEYASKTLEIYRDARKRLSRRFPEIESTPLTELLPVTYGTFACTLQSAPEFAAYRRTCCAIPSRPE